MDRTPEQRSRGAGFQSRRVSAGRPGLPPGASPDVSTDDPRWRAVLARDRRADGRFVFSVSTTGIYCRPSCPARRPNRAHVRFHRSPAEAAAAGFRACRRCAPDGPSLAERHESLVAAACRTIEAAEGPISLPALARAAALTPHHFHRVFRAVTGVTPRAYAAAHRRSAIAAALTSGATVTEALYDAGFGSSSRFYAASREALGMSPRRYKEGGRDMTIEFAVGACRLGLVLVARTSVGVCGILLGDDRTALDAELRGRFPQATLVAGHEAFGRTLEAVIRAIDDPSAEVDLPLDVRGTAFQQRVWQALREIPPGETMTYGALAARVGAPGAMRAVGAACGANPVAIAIPCHRAVGSDGSLRGYRWGVERKRALLAREAEARGAEAEGSASAGSAGPGRRARPGRTAAGVTTRRS